MQVIQKEIEISTDKPVTLIPISDIHMGNCGCDIEKLTATIKWIKDHGAYTVLLGDQCDSIIADDKRFENDSIHPDFRDKLDNLPHSQTMAVAKLFKPIKDHIIGVMGGNHEQTIKTHYSYDSAAILAETLGVPNMSDPSYIQLRFRRSKTSTFNVRILASHGLALGGGKKMGSKINNIRDLSAGFHADIFMMGHTHALFAVDDKYITLDPRGKVVSKKRTYINTGSFQNTYDIDGEIDTWASRKLFHPTRTGVARVDFYLKPVGKSYKIDVHSRV